jgi:hypothetical protein
VRSGIDKVLPKPYTLDPEVRHGLERLFRSQQLLALEGNGLSFITCRKGAGEFTIGIANNTWTAQPFRLKSLCGPLESVRELTLDVSEKSAVGYAPESVDAARLGQSGENIIAGGAVRVFVVRVKERDVEEIPHVAPSPRPRGRILPMRQASLIKEEILSRPTFFQHFDAVCVDWKYLHDREKAALEKEAGWLKRQGLRIYVDLSSGVNLYPALRLLDNLHSDYESSMSAIQNVLSKMPLLDARDLILPLHRHPENNFTDEQSREAFTATLKTLASEAARRNIMLHLRLAPGRRPWTLGEALDWLERVGAPNLKLAVSTALLADKAPSAEATARLKDALGLWLVSASRKDAAGKVWDVHTPINSAPNPDGLGHWLSFAPDSPMLLDGLYSEVDGEYSDAIALESVLARLNRRH